MRTHRIEKPMPGCQPAYLANGLVGLRIPQIPLPQGTALVNGFVGLSPETGHEQCGDAPYPVGADIAIGGVWLSDRPDLAAFVSQEYDFACGELRSAFTFADILPRIAWEPPTPQGYSLFLFLAVGT